MSEKSHLEPYGSRHWAATKLFELIVRAESDKPVTRDRAYYYRLYQECLLTVDGQNDH